MTKDSLLLFMKRILANGTEEKSNMVLNQLKEILSEQKADYAMIALINKTLESLPEAKTASRADSFSEEDLQIAFRRAADRKRREMEAAYYGRCR